MRKYRCFFGLFLILLCTSVVEAAKPTLPRATVKVTGASYIIAEDVDNAYQKATKVVALCRALERVTNQMLEQVSRSH